MRDFTGIEYIKIDIANSFGHGKLSWNERIAWTDANIEDEENDNTDNLIAQADEPALMRKGIYAMFDALRGTPTGFIMGLDATASGLQIMSALMGCETTAASVNLVNTGKRECVYKKVAEDMGVDADDVKKPVMTTFYGSLEQPKSVFGEGEELEEFYDALDTVAPGAMECMGDIQSCWDPHATKYEWKLPDGHTAVMKVMVTVDKKIEVDELDHATFTYRTQINEATEYGVALAANVIHSFDGWVVREMYRKAAEQGFDLLTIHDSFWASPNHMNKVRQNYIDILTDIADSNYLQSVIRDITGNPEEEIIRISENLGRKIQESDYALS